MHRKRIGLAQHEMAVLLGCSHASKVSRYELSRVHPPLDVLIAYEVIFRGSARDLFAGHHYRIVRDIRRRAAALARKVGRSQACSARGRKLAFLEGLSAGAFPIR
jgi:transcriptional regulator with XRE-family HTH domain